MFGRGQAEGGCRRCSRCSIHYPDQQRFQTCEVCEEPTSRFTNVDPDPEWEESVRYAKMQPPPPVGRDPHEHRFEQYLKMGFDEVRSQALASAVYGSPPFPLYHGLVSRALDAGCDPEIAFEMFT